MANDVMNANEALVAMPLPAMLAGLGRAVATANQELSKASGPDGPMMQVTEATIELNVAISVDTSQEIKVDGGLALKAFSVNASYSRTFSFKEEASSKIKMTLVITPRNAPAIP
jgi:hypothetical protein